MNVYKAELFRYCKSFYSRLILILVIPVSFLVAAFLYYVSNSVNSDLLMTAGFSEAAVMVLKKQMGGVSYIAAAFSASELLLLLIMLPIIIHISDDYEQNTLRYEIQRSAGRTACYMARMMAAVTYAWGILSEYILMSGCISAVFFHKHAATAHTGKVLLAVGLQFIVTAACVMFFFMLVSLIRHPVLSMAAVILLVIFFTSGIRVLTDLCGLPADAENIWIIQLLSVTSDLSFNGKDSAGILMISLLYALLSNGMGIHFFKSEKL